MTLAISTRTPQQALAALLENYAPQHLLLVGASQLPALSAYQEAHPTTQLAHAPAGPLPAELAARRYDLAVVVDCLEHLPKRMALELLGGIRNLNASRLAVLVDRGGRQLPIQADYAAARVALPAASTLALARSEAGGFSFHVEQA